MNIFEQWGIMGRNEDLIIAAIREKYPEKNVSDDYLQENFLNVGNGDFVELTLEGHYFNIYV